LIATGARNFFNQAFGPQLGKVITEQGQGVLRFDQTERIQRRGVEVGSGKSAASGNVGEGTSACITASCRG
jgi:hypothetical protein